MSMSNKWYKITGLNGEPLNGGSGNWHLPNGKKPGKWMLRVENVVACHSGYHLVEAGGIVEWLPRAPQSGLLWSMERTHEQAGRAIRTRNAEGHHRAEPLVGDHADADLAARAGACHHRAML